MRFLVRLSWLAAALVPGSLGAGSATVPGSVLVWAAWGAVAVSTLLQHPLSLTTIRFLGPMLVAHSASRLVLDGWGWPAAALGLLAFSAGAAYSADYGALHAQAAAYGHERRHLLRPPVAVILPLMLLWLVVAALAAVATRSASLAVALPAGAVGLPLLAFALRRALVLARRWLVFVPAGVAIHDPLVLRDTFMVRSNDVRVLRRSPGDGEAFDATGTTWGVPLELVLAHPHDVSLSNFGARVIGTLDRLHVGALLVSPSRPDAALESARRPALS